MERRRQQNDSLADGYLQMLQPIEVLEVLQLRADTAQWLAQHAAVGMAVEAASTPPRAHRGYLSTVVRRIPQWASGGGGGSDEVDV